MKKFLSLFTSILVILISCFFIAKPVIANSIQLPDDVVSYDSPNLLPLPSNSLLGNAELVDEVLVNGFVDNGQYYRLYKYEVPVYCLLGLDNNYSNYLLLTENSSYNFTYTESYTISTSYSTQVSSENSLSLSSELGAKLGFSGIGIETSVSQNVSNSLSMLYSDTFTYSTIKSQTTNVSFNVIQSGRYRLEKRAFLSVYVVQCYTVITTENINNVNRTSRYYFDNYSIRLGLNNDISYEIGMMKYLFENNKYVFDKDYYSNAFNNGNSNFLVI